MEWGYLRKPKSHEASAQFWWVEFMWRLALNPQSPIQANNRIPAKDALFVGIRHIFHQFLDPAVEIGAKPIQIFGPGAPSWLIEDS
jgi:hypothetical protein